MAVISCGLVYRCVFTSSIFAGSLAHTHSVKPQRGNGKSRGKGGKGGNGWKGGKGKTFRGHGKADPDFSVIMQELWDLDINGLNSTTMRLALQGNTTIKSKEDMAPAK